MTLRIVTSTATRPISGAMADHSAACTEMLVATAFITDDVIDGVLMEAIERADRAGARVKFLTGTFGNATRKRTFQKLLRLADRHEHVSVGIWTAGRGGNFHAKMYVWRMPRERGVGWIGSSNFTKGGVQNEGELLAEVRGPWSSGSIAAMRAAFRREWAHSEPLDQRFIDRYVEAPRLPPDGAVHRRARRANLRAVRRAKDALLVFSVADWIPEGSAIARRVEELLGGIADEWSRIYPAAARAVRDGDHGLLVSRPERKVFLVRMIADAQRDGRATVLAHDTIVGRPWNEATRAALADIAIAIPTRSARLPPTRWAAVPWNAVAGALRRV